MLPAEAVTPIDSGNGLQEQVAVIGGGIAGLVVAEKLALNGYNVSLIEQSAELMEGTSRYAIQAHLGGLYSGNLESAQDCLVAATNFKKEFPGGVNNLTARFFVANDSDLDFSGYVEFYQELADFYASLPSDNQVFGRPEKFYKVLDIKEHKYIKGVEGGIRTHEPGLNMPDLRLDLINRLGNLGVRCLTSTEVMSVQMVSDEFDLELKYPNGEINRRRFSQVVNAAGYNARLLDQELGDTTNYSLYLKAWNFVTNCVSAKLVPPFFVVQGNFMHYTPLGKKGIGSLIVANEDCSYIDTLHYDDQSAVMPQEWDEILRRQVVPDARRRQAAIMEYASDNYFKQPNLVPVRMFPGVAVSYSTSRQDRTQKPVNSPHPGWQTVVPTKITQVVELARQATDNAVELSVLHGRRRLKQTA